MKYTDKEVTEQLNIIKNCISGLHKEDIECLEIAIVKLKEENKELKERNKYLENLVEKKQDRIMDLFAANERLMMKGWNE